MARRAARERGGGGNSLQRLKLAFPGGAANSRTLGRGGAGRERRVTNSWSQSPRPGAGLARGADPAPGSGTAAALGRRRRGCGGVVGTGSPPPPPRAGKAPSGTSSAAAASCNSPAGGRPRLLGSQSIVVNGRVTIAAGSAADPRPRSSRPPALAGLLVHGAACLALG